MDDRWPHPPHYENPTIPEIPSNVSCFGECIKVKTSHRFFTPESLVEEIKALVCDSDSCFRLVVSEGDEHIWKLQSIHSNLLQKINNLERSVNENLLLRGQFSFD